MHKPHIHGRGSAALKTWKTVLCLLPALLAGVLLYQVWALKQTAVVLSAVILAEVSGRLLQGRRISLGDGHSVLAGLLLAAILPPGLPLWMSFTAGFFSLLLYREFFGGTGQNPFQGILVAYLFLQISFPLAMNYYVLPFSFDEAVRPLWLWRQDTTTVFSAADLLLGKYAGGIATTCAGAVIVSGLLVIWQRLIFWETALLFLAGVAAVSSLNDIPLTVALLSGNTLIAAFFLVHGTGAVPHSRRGMQIYALTAGVLAAGLREITPYFDGCFPAVLMMSAFAPWLDRMLRPHGRDSVLRSVS